MNRETKITETPNPTRSRPANRTVKEPAAPNKNRPQGRRLNTRGNNLPGAEPIVQDSSGNLHEKVYIEVNCREAPEYSRGIDLKFREELVHDYGRRNPLKVNDQVGKLKTGQIAHLLALIFRPWLLPSSSPPPPGCRSSTSFTFSTTL